LSDAGERRRPGATLGAPALELINRRYSCRLYRDEPVAPATLRDLMSFLESHTVGPFGSRARFAVVAAAPSDPRALRRLGTYGFIKGAQAFLVGAVERGPKDCEDYGYLVEQAILRATGLGLQSCWLGGTFTRSSFARRLGSLRREELMPAVVALGYPGDDGGAARIREREAGSRRLPASSLFFEGRLGEPLETTVASDGAAEADLSAILTAVRMAPSATNKQPWRLVRRGGEWHFLLARSKGYGQGSLVFTMLRLADLQRVDLGIAMCHFELVAREAGRSGEWVVEEPSDLLPPDAGVEYVATWRERA